MLPAKLLDGLRNEMSTGIGRGLFIENVCKVVC